MSAPRWSYPPTNLSAGSFTLMGGLQVRNVRDPSLAVIAEVDREWAPQRRPTDVDWSWKDLLPDARDMFAVLRVTDGAPVAMFCSVHPRLLRIDAGPAYCLHFIEVAPAVRKADVGLFTMALAAARALECGARKLVLASTLDARKLYDRTGGKQRKVTGWKVPKGLLPYEYLEEDLVLLREVLNERREE